jgi:hypothetical protein
MIKNIYFVFIILLIIPLVSANGLCLNNNQTIYINKTYNQNQDFIVQVRNCDSISFYNLTIDSPSFSMTTIPTLQPNQSVNVTVTTTTNDNYVGKLHIKGYYSANVGASNETIPITVNYANQVNPCSFNIVKGDTLVWNNTDTESLDIWNSDNSNKITTIPSGQTYSQTFNNPLLFNYYFTWLRFDFGHCSVNVLSDSGYINNPDFDAIADLNVQVNYKPTILTANFPQTNYSMSVIQSQDGLILLTNTGSETAKGITLSGSWFQFTPNNFDLASGVSKTISYTIIPLVTTTNETNQTYNKNIQIIGNFPTIVQNFSIFVQYADMSSSGLGQASLDELLKQFCIDNPTLCGGNTQVVLGNGSGSGNLTQEQFRQIISFLSLKFELYDAEMAFMKDANNVTQTQAQAQTQILNQTAQDVSQLKNDNQYRITFVQVIIIGVAFFVIIIGGMLIIKHYKNKKEMEKLRRW